MEKKFGSVAESVAQKRTKEALKKWGSMDNILVEAKKIVRELREKNPLLDAALKRSSKIYE